MLGISDALPIHDDSSPLIGNHQKSGQSVSLTGACAFFISAKKTLVTPKLAPVPRANMLTITEAKI